MLTRRSQSGRVEYGIRDFYIDTPADFEILKQQDCKPGSTAKVILTGEFYIKNSQGAWIKQPSGTNSSDGGDFNPADSYLWDGGLIQ